jgi:hypothetical protein
MQEEMKTKGLLLNKTDEFLNNSITITGSYPGLDIFSKLSHYITVGRLIRSGPICIRFKGTVQRDVNTVF